MSGAFLMAAPNGARKTKADHPNLPIGPKELAAEAVRCLEAGAAALHMHVRGKDDEHVLDADLCRAATAAVREAVGDDLVIQITTEAVGRFSVDEQMAVVRAVEPEAVSVALREIVPDAASKEAAHEFFAWMAERRIWPQIILYDGADAERFLALHETGLFAMVRPFLLFVLGRYTPGQRSTPEDVDPFVAAMGDRLNDVRWGLCAFGPRENDCVARALDLGGHARIGFENNMALPDGTNADYTADLVALAASRAKDIGRPLLDAASVREMISEDF